MGLCCGVKRRGKAGKGASGRGLALFGGGHRVYIFRGMQGSALPL